MLGKKIQCFINRILLKSITSVTTLSAWHRIGNRERLRPWGYRLGDTLHNIIVISNDLCTLLTAHNLCLQNLFVSLQISLEAAN